MVIYGQARADQTRPGQTLTERQTLRWLLKFKWIFAWIFIRDRRFVSGHHQEKERETHTLFVCNFWRMQKSSTTNDDEPNKATKLYRLVYSLCAEEKTGLLNFIINCLRWSMEVDESNWRRRRRRRRRWIAIWSSSVLMIIKTVLGLIISSRNIP